MEYYVITKATKTIKITVTKKLRADLLKTTILLELGNKTMGNSPGPD